MRTTTTKKWKKAETTKQPSVTLFNLVPGETFVFRVRAENATGQSEPSEESEPILIKALEKPAEEPKQEPREEESPEAVDYDSLDSTVDLSDRKAIDANRLPSDLEAKYIICEELGQGAYGTVYRAIEKATGKTWAAKMVQVRPGVKREDVLHEISMMNQLNHEKLLNLHEAFDLGSEICLIEEFVSGGELLDKIMEDDMLMSEKEVKDYMRQILQGLEHMHNKQIVHLDLKPENILLKTKISKDIKLIDFGLARKLDPKKTEKLLFGTPEFCAPEVVNYEPVGLSTDMWSVGVIAYVLLSGLSPFFGATDEETLANVSAADWDFDDAAWDDVSETAKDFICRLMVKDKRKRMTVQQALEHPFIKEKEKALPVRGQLTPQQKRKFMQLRRWSGDDLLPIGRLAKRGAIFRQQSMDGVFERNISFDGDYPPSVKSNSRTSSPMWVISSRRWNRRAKEPQKPGAAPSFAPALKDCSGKLGEKLALSVGCKTEVKVEWFHNGVKISESDENYIRKQEKGRYELTIKNVNMSDEGEWRVIGKDAVGQCESSCTVSVQTPDGFMAPTFERVLEDVRCEEQELLTLSVKIAANPAPEITWYCDDNEIKHSDRYRVLFDDDKREYSVIIVNAYAEDSGEYRCFAKNLAGEAQSVCSVRIEEPEDKRSRKIDESKAPTFSMPLSSTREVTEGAEMILTCVVTGTPYPKIKWSKDGTR
ncbi:kinase domain protein [Ancylostoma duodenale]|uniref:Kinase domain protein n=1 Tax=Ancylostoma duodenale TaxID=51022 RepID=A0A0C2CEJ2_9BILA|nr:kinase domain protein [Ancylostoma duodenale]